MRQSIWEGDVEFPSFPKLEGDIKTDVLVIGGGLCGVLCAWFLKQAGVDYVLVEGDAVGRGVTCNTTAKITSQHGLIYEKLLRTQGKEKALQYLDANQWALGKYRELAEVKSNRLLKIQILHSIFHFSSPSSLLCILSSIL